MTAEGADAAELAVLATAFRDLAGRMGIPEIVQTPGDSLPGSTTANVVYDLGVAISLALGDAGEALDVAAGEARRSGGAIS